MPLFTTNIESVGGTNTSFVGRDGKKLFNTIRVSSIYTFGSESAFDYSLEWDGDVNTKTVICDATVSEVMAQFAESFVDEAIELNSYPYKDTTLDTELIYLDPRIILFADEFDDYTKIILDHAKELLVTETIDDILLKSIASEAVVVDNPAYWDDGTSYFRLDVRDGALNLDQRITELGWEGVEDTGWGNIWSKTL